MNVPFKKRESRSHALLLAGILLGANALVAAAAEVTYKIKVPSPGVKSEPVEEVAPSAPSAGGVLASMSTSGGSLWASKVCGIGDASCSDGSIYLGINPGISGLDTLTGDTPTYMVCRRDSGSMTLTYNEPVSIQTIRAGSHNENGYYYSKDLLVSYEDDQGSMVEVGIKTISKDAVTAFSVDIPSTTKLILDQKSGWTYAHLCLTVEVE